MVDTPVEQRVSNIEEALGKLIDVVADLGKKLETAQKTTTKAKGLFGGKREHVAMKDTKTGKLYPSKARLAKELAPEFGLSQDDHFAIYKIMAKAPDRFVEATSDEAQSTWDEEKAQIAREVEAMNKAIAAEEAAKAKQAETAARPPAPVKK